MAATAQGVNFSPEGQQMNSEGEGDTSSRQNSQQAKGTLDLMSAAGISRTNGTREAKGAFERLVKLDNHNPVTNAVIDRARMMVKEGGGEVILDLGNETLGKVELAMNVMKDRVDLRIIAASDQVREVLSQDITTLREALAIQDLNLSEVEVAVSDRNGSAFTQFSEENQSQHEDTHDENGQPNGEIFKQSRTSTFVSRGRGQTPPAHQGSIQVRV